MSTQPSKPPAILQSPFPVGAGVNRFEVKNLDQRWYSDVYHYLLAISWWRLIGVFFLIYIGTNALFGLLFWLGGNDISNARPGSYVDAFWFSVQTYATIGYGSMAPTTNYAHVLVTLEAFAGMMALALSTGIVFAKFSRPTARIAFSRNIVVHVRNGRPVLEFRLANQRRGSLSDAIMKFSVIRDEITAEGQPMRRGYPLELERAHMPVLTLAWNCIHLLDDHSPLRGLCPGDPLESVTGFIAILTAHDDTMGDTVYARQFWNRDDVRHNVRFDDMIDTKSTPGVISIDHAKLHDLQAISVTPALSARVASDADSDSGAPSQPQ